MLTECIASVFPLHTGVITCRAEENKCCVALKILNLKLYQYLAQHMARKKHDTAYSVSIVLRVFVSAKFFNLKNNFLYLFNIGK